MFRPREVTELVVEEVERDPEKSEMAEAFAAQASLLGDADLQQQRRALEQIPYRFQYRYLCAADGCPGHLQSIVDWEIAAHFRRIRDRNDWRQKMRERWLDEMCGPGKETAFIVGNQHQHPDGFLVLGVWWPPADPTREAGQLSLSDTGDF
jgi:hypothetical protein